MRFDEGLGEKKMWHEESLRDKVGCGSCLALDDKARRDNLF